MITLRKSYGKAVIGLLIGAILIGSVSIGTEIRGTETSSESTAKGDIVFVFDATGSMSWIIGEMQGKAIDIMNAVRISVPDTRFGVASFTDYPGSYTSNGYSARYSGTGDYAWRMDLACNHNLLEVRRYPANE